MFTIQGVRTLHDETHARLDLVLQHVRTMPPELLTQSVPGFGSASIRDQLVHVISVEGGWISRVRGNKATYLSNADYPTVDEIERIKKAVKNTTDEYLDSLDDTTLNQTLIARPIEWSGPLRSPGFIFHHIITHTFHHKGQMGSMFRLLGYPIGDTDLQRDD